jgi:hypothetical protein
MMKQKWFDICPLLYPPSSFQICGALVELVITANVESESVSSIMNLEGF